VTPNGEVTTKYPVGVSNIKGERFSNFKGVKPAGLIGVSEFPSGIKLSGVTAGFSGVYRWLEDEV
jgi:hypothetical protein